ncbi:MAG TPA: hypothetical protein VKB31_06935 [Trueperaceae bacterium]|nr:hypothetical protein [Trueperaceae bacterium]
MSAAAAVVGHQAARIELARLYDRDGPHTLLIAGPEGVGRRPVARWLAARLNCAAPDPAGRPCGTCSSCRAVDAGEHPDVREVGPGRTTRSGRSRRRREITIDQLVNRPQGDPDPLGPWLELRPRFRRRVGIVDHAESLTAGAANAFLKMLEEPPAWAVVVLIATGPDALLPTVASRCTTMRLGAVDVRGYAGLAPHPALRLGLPGPLERARSDLGAFAASRDAVETFVVALGGELADTLEAADAVARLAEAAAADDGDAPSPLALLRERLRDLPPARYAAAIDALERCETALAAYANAQLTFTTLALDLRALASG